jgi:hypothetical protein
MGYILAVLLNPAFLFSLIISIALCFHIVRTRQDTFWLWIVLFFQGIGSLAYIAVILIPSLMSGTAARKLGQSARATLDPGREYREAKQACDDTPTVANQMRLAAAAAAQGRYEEAEQLYRNAAEGVHADDPSLKLGRGRALIELGRYADALTVLESLAAQGEEGNTPQAVLARARAYHGLKRMAEAETNYSWASERMPGFEAIARFTAFLAEAGRMKEARENLLEIDRRIERLSGPFRKEAQGWRDLAAAKIR